MIDDFRLWGSRRCRQMGVPLSDGGWLIQVVHAFDNHNAPLREGEALAVVVWDFPETRHWTRDNTDFPHPLRISEARLRLACPPLARRGGAPHERGAGGGSAPPFLAAGAARGRAKVDKGPDTLCLPLAGRSLPPQ